MGAARRRRIALEGASALTLEKVQVGCELALLFMLWHVPRTREADDASGLWFHRCIEESVKYPDGSLRHVWWWGMRNLCRPEAGATLEAELLDFRAYVEWKTEQYNSGAIRRSGPRL